MCNQNCVFISRHHNCSKEFLETWKLIPLFSTLSMLSDQCCFFTKYYTQFLDVAATYIFVLLHFKIEFFQHSWLWGMLIPCHICFFYDIYQVNLKSCIKLRWVINTFNYNIGYKFMIFNNFQRTYFPWLDSIDFEDKAKLSVKHNMHWEVGLNIVWYSYLKPIAGN